MTTDTLNQRKAARTGSPVALLLLAFPLWTGAATVGYPPPPGDYPLDDIPQSATAPRPARPAPATQNGTARPGGSRMLSIPLDMGGNDSSPLDGNTLFGAPPADPPSPAAELPPEGPAPAAPWMAERPQQAPSGFEPASRPGPAPGPPRDTAPDRGPTGGFGMDFTRRQPDYQEGPAAESDPLFLPSTAAQQRFGPAPNQAPLTSFDPPPTSIVRPPTTYPYVQGGPTGGYGSFYPAQRPEPVPDRAWQTPPPWSPQAPGMPADRGSTFGYGGSDGGPATTGATTPGHPFAPAEPPGPAANDKPMQDAAPADARGPMFRPPDLTSGY